MKTKQCSNKECLVPIKPISEFHKDNRTNGIRSTCKICVKADTYRKKEAKIIYDKEYNKKFPWKYTLKHIKQRCNNPNFTFYKNYGGRGIECRITEEELKELWFRDEAYLMDKPTIDRKNNNGHYEFGNCEYIEKSINSGKDKTRVVLQFDLNRMFVRE